MFGTIRKLRHSVKTYVCKDDGATAVEFALLALPFGALLFAIIETAIVFFISSALAHAVSESSRHIRTGEFQSTCSNDATAFKALICTEMAGLGDCSNRLRVDVQNLGSTFKTNGFPAAPAESGDPDEESEIPVDDYEATAGRDVVIVRAQYFHKLSMPRQVTLLGNRNGNVRLIQTTTAFRNEPFPGGCS